MYLPDTDSCVASAVSENKAKGSGFHVTAGQNPSGPSDESISTAAIARSFGRAASAYDQHAQLQRQVADTLLAQLLFDKPVTTILDMGSGTGYCSVALHKRYPGALVVALDLALPMLQYLAARGVSAIDSIVEPGSTNGDKGVAEPSMPSELALICGHAEALPLGSEQFDLVVSSLMMQWCANIPALFAELRRVLRPGGQILLSTFGPATLQELRKAWASVDALQHVNTFPGSDALMQMARESGFQASMNTEIRMRHYPSLRSLANEIKGIGAHNMNGKRKRGLTSRAAFRQAEQAFARNQVPGLGIPVTWETLMLDLRKP